MLIRANNDRHPGRLERLGLPATIRKPIRTASILIRSFWREVRAAIIGGLRLVWKERRELRPLINPNSSLLFEGARYSADMPLLAGTDLSPEIQHEHFAEACAPPIKIVTLRNVLVSGRSCVGTHRHVYLLGNLLPRYVDEHLAKGLLGDDDLLPPWKHVQYLLADDLVLTWKKERYLPGASILLTHFGANAYGHWLLECIPRLLLLRRIQDKLSRFRIIVHKSTESFIKQWLSFILPKVEIKIYDDATEYVRCESLLIPSLLCGQDYAFHPLLNSLIAELVPTNALPKRRLYFTRQVPGKYRRLSNKEEIESIASSFGLELISPETLPISMQLKLFSECAFAVGEYGSVLHNTLFSPLGIRVLTLNWMGGVQSKISQLRKQSVGYLLPSSGLMKYEWGAALHTYHIDPRRFRDILSVID